MKYHQLAWVAVILALGVVVLGAFVRLSDAGLGCPDWPGCYGQMDWPTQHEEIQQANSEFPDRPVEPHKAWREMVHRYFAGTLGLLVLALFIWAWSKRDEGINHQDAPVGLATALLIIIILQAALGMWTVTLKLKPVIVMLHLLGGLTTLSLLLWLALRTTPNLKPYRYAGHVKPWMIGLGLLLLVMQIALGGWTSSNYAALACPDFPTCQGSWWPHMDFSEAFVLWRGIGPNYEFGVLDMPARTAIHMAHRMGFLLVSLYLIWLAFRLMKNRELLPWGVGLLALLTLQITLGISNVVFSLPLPVATLHNMGAALLLMFMVALLYKTRQSRSPAAA